MKKHLFVWIKKIFNATYYMMQTNFNKNLKTITE